MKKEIHPQYHNAKVTCACGNSFTVGASVEKIQVEICSACHPFFTGNEKIIDIAGMVEKFKGRAAKATKTTKATQVKKKASKSSASAGK